MYNIEKYKPCGDGLEYYNSQPDFETAWNNCSRGDWMLWAAKKLDVNKKLISKAKGLCAQTVLHLVTDNRCKKAVQAAIDYADGKITDDQLETAADAAHAADAAYTAAATYAAAYAAAAAYVAAAAAYAAGAAAAAAHAAAYAAYTIGTDAYAASKSNQMLTANICRDILTEAVFNKVKED